MLRRSFLGSAPLWGVLDLARGASLDKIAITIDDFRWNSLDQLPVKDLNAHQAILQALSKHSLQAGLFVIGQNLEEPRGRDLLANWDRAGHRIGNHSYSHKPYPSAPDFEAYCQDILRCEEALRNYPQFRKLYRHVMLKEGKTAAQRDALRQFLKEHGYRNAHVTVDASDWYYNSRLLARLKTDPNFDVTRYREPYVTHVLTRAAYYRQLARQMGLTVPAHTVLLHYNLINALFLGDVLAAFKNAHWGLLNIDEAYSAPFFEQLPNVVPAGESLVWSLAKQSGKMEDKLRYPAEDGVYEQPILDRLGL